MIPEPRPLTYFEKGFVASKEMMEFAVEVSNPSFIPLIVENVKREMVSLRLKTDGERLFCTGNRDSDVIKLPNNIKSAQEAANFIERQPIDFNKTLALVAANDRFVAVCASHMVCDGRYFIGLYKKLLDDPTKKKISLCLPEPPDSLFQDVFQKMDPKFGHDEYEREFHSLTHCKWSKDRVKLPPNTQCTYINMENDANDYEFMRSKSGLSESYWTIWPLTLMAFDGTEQFSNFGISTCVDLRPYLKRPVDHTVGNNFIDLNLCVKGDVSNLTLKELGAKIRGRLIEQRDNNGFFVAFNAMRTGYNLPTRQAIHAEVSNIGRFDKQDHILDSWVQQAQASNDAAEEMACISAFSKNKYGVNTIVTRFQYTPAAMSPKDMEILSKSLVRAMKEIPVSTNVREAYNEIRRFQRQLA